MSEINNVNLHFYSERGLINRLIEWLNRKFQRCPFNVGKPFFRWGYVILSQNKSDLVVF